MKNGHWHHPTTLLMNENVVEKGYLPCYASILVLRMPQFSIGGGFQLAIFKGLDLRIKLVL